jgi:hypothetical protein
MRIENEWRAMNCPEGYDMAYCENYYPCEDCPGLWTCDDIDMITMEFIAYYDTNVDGAINPEDSMDAEHYEILLEWCDTNDDGNVSECEVHECIVECENAWRNEYCEGYG